LRCARYRRHDHLGDDAAQRSDTPALEPKLRANLGHRAGRGAAITPEALAGTSPYLTEHLYHFGSYELDLSRPAAAVMRGRGGLCVNAWMDYAEFRVMPSGGAPPLQSAPAVLVGSA